MQQLPLVTDHLAVALVNELEALGARFDFYLDDQNKVRADFICTGTTNMARCREILRLCNVASDFGDSFRDEVTTRYLAGRMHMLPMAEART